MPRIIVLGAGGQFGRQIVARLHCNTRWDTRGFRRQDLDVTDTARVRRVIEACRPRWVINAAAITDVESCEGDSDGANEINGHAVGRLASLCNASGATLVYISTDFVFDGQQAVPYREADSPRPLSVYARSKLLGEQMAENAVRCLIMRTAWLYGPGGRNFIDTVMDRAGAGEPLRVVDDQVGSPSYAVDIAECLENLLHVEAEGVYHVVNGGAVSRYETARTAVALAGMNVPVEAVPTRVEAGGAVRPGYSVLDCAKYVAATGHEPRPWKDALIDYISSRHSR